MLLAIDWAGTDCEEAKAVRTIMRRNADILQSDPRPVPGWHTPGEIVFQVSEGERRNGAQGWPGVAYQIGAFRDVNREDLHLTEESLKQGVQLGIGKSLHIGTAPPGLVAGGDHQAIRRGEEAEAVGAQHPRDFCQQCVG